MRFELKSQCILLVCALSIIFNACTHDPPTTVVGPNAKPVDTTSVDTIRNPCDPNTVYFEKQVLPILLSSCAISVCHDPISKEDGVVLNSFENVIKTGDIDAFDPGG